jgi:hypothetical protein
MPRPKGSKNKPKSVDVSRRPFPLETPKPEQAPPIPVVPPPHSWSVKHWKSNPAAQHELQVMLDNPIFKMACHTLMMSAMPAAIPGMIPPGMSAETAAMNDSQRLFHKSGFAAFYRALHNLARPAAMIKRDPEFGDLLDEDEKPPIHRLQRPTRPE